MLALCLLLVLVAPLPTAAASPTAGPEIRLIDGFANEEELIERLVRSLENHDKDGLLELMLTRDEYRDLIIPGSVPPGQPWRDWPQKVRQYHTDEFFAKNYYIAEDLLDRFGGRKLTVKRVRFTEGTRRYASYNARGEVRIEVDMVPAGPPNPVVRVGWIAEVGGTYKLLGFRASRD